MVRNRESEPGEEGWLATNRDRLSVQFPLTLFGAKRSRGATQILGLQTKPPRNDCGPGDSLNRCDTAKNGIVCDGHPGTLNP